MSVGGGMPSPQSPPPATGATGSSPSTSQPMQSFQSPAGGKGGYSAPQQMNPFASQYQQPQQMRQVDNVGMGNFYARQPTMRQRYGNPYSDNVFADEGPQPQYRTLGPESLMSGYGKPPQPFNPEQQQRLNAGYQNYLAQPISPEIPLQPGGFGLAGLMGGLQRPAGEDRKVYPQVTPPTVQPVPYEPRLYMD